MSEFLTTHEVADLLRIKVRKVYDLASRGKIPCSRATGKLLFPKDAVHRWLANNGTPPPAADEQQSLPNVLLGSHDPLLEWALRASGCGIATFFDGSLDGVMRFLDGAGMASAMHIYNRKSGEWNIPCVRDKLHHRNVALMEWAKRDRGIILSEACTRSVTHIADVAGLTLVPRQPGAGSQQLFEQLLDDAGIGESDCAFVTPERTESDAVLPLLEHKADASFGLPSVAEQYKLRFVPVIQERVDIAVDRKAWFEPAWQHFLRFCGSDTFANKTATTEGYDFRSFGTIHYNAD